MSKSKLPSIGDARLRTGDPAEALLTHRLLCGGRRHIVKAQHDADDYALKKFPMIASIMVS